MSAYHVGRLHVDVILASCMVGQQLYDPTCSPVRWLREAGDEPVWSELRDEEVNRIGGELLAENTRSLVYRYHDASDLIPDDVLLEEYVFTYPAFNPTAVEGLKAIACFVYQACEHSEFEASEASRFCEAARLYLVHFVPGYEEATWHWDESTVAARLGGVSA